MKAHRISLLTLVLAALVAGCGIREQEREYRNFFNQTAKELVPGLRLPDESQYGPAWAFIEGQGWETRDGSGETKAEFWTSGEFNGDEATDYAYILVDEESEARNLIAFVSATDGYRYRAEQLTTGFEWGIWLRTRASGRYMATPSGEGAADVSPTTQFEVRNQAIDLFETGGSTVTFVWDESSQAFNRYSVSD